MCCLLLVATFIGPRFAFITWWIFGDKPEAAFDTWYWPLLGVIFVPWTTLAYTFAWSPGAEISGLGDWLIIGLGVVLDIAWYLYKPTRRYYSRSYYQTN